MKKLKIPFFLLIGFHAAFFFTAYYGPWICQIHPDNNWRGLMFGICAILTPLTYGMIKDMGRFE